MRDVRLDRLKTGAIFGIVMIHAFYQSGYFDIVPEFSFGWMAGMLIYTLLFAMTNVFVIISSWFLIDGRFRWRKVRDLMTVTAGFSLVIYLLVTVLGGGDFSPVALVECILSPLVNQYWFVSAYLILYILSPYLNKALGTLSARELGALCLILLAVFSLLPTVLVFEPAQSLFDAKNGKGILWFVTLYILTFSLKRHGGKLMAVRSRWLILTAAGSVLALVASNAVLMRISMILGMGGDGAARLYFDSCIFMALISFPVFILSLRQKSRTGSRIWSRLAGASLAVYLIHEQPALKAVLWPALNRQLEAHPAAALPLVLTAGIGVCGICLAVELLRQMILKKVIK